MMSEVQQKDTNNKDIGTYKIINMTVKKEEESGKCNGILQTHYCSVFNDNRSGLNGSVKCYSGDFKTLFVVNMNNLKMLNLSCCGLSSVPDLSVLRNLISLNLSHNYLKTLPNQCGYMNKLRHLYLSYNSFTEVPSCILDGLGVLKTLDLSHNKLCDFVVKKQSLQLLEKLNLSCNKLISIPEWLVTNKNSCIRELDLSENGELLKRNLSNETIHDLNLMKNSLSNSLRVLKLSSCFLCNGKEKLFSAFKNLEVLYLNNDVSSMGVKKRSTHNRLFDIPVKNLINAEKMRELHLSGVYLVNIKSNINKFKNLKFLDLSYNDIYNLPSEFCELKELNYLNISNNFLSELPGDFGKLVSLKTLFLSSNKLLVLPESFVHLKNLEVLDLYDNCLEELDEFLFEMNLRELDLAYNYFNPFSVSSGINHDKYKKLRRDFIANTLKSAFSRFDYQRQVSDLDNDFSDSDDDILSGRSYFRVSCEDDLSDDNYIGDEFLSQDRQSVQVVKEEQNEKYKEEVEEDWDRDYDSDEMFDPNDNTSYYCGNNKLIQIESMYCPAVHHPASIALKRKQREVETVEGQFDDA